MLKDFFKDYQPDNRDWLILGKGPTLDALSTHSTSKFNTISLNHALRSCPVDWGHIIDLDVLGNLGEIVLSQCKNLVMPYYPHLGWRPNPQITLRDISEKSPILKTMADEGRLYGYNLSTIGPMHKVGDSSVVRAKHFSAEAVVNLLGNLGVKRIRTIGVDGGKGQAKAFQDLQNINQNGYDSQWVGIRKSISKFHLDYSPLGTDSPIRIFIGAGTAQLIPAFVLKHSILKHAMMSVDVTIMNEWTHPMPKDAKNRPRTPFSFQRFMIPEKLNGGLGIYMDSDMLVFADVKEIWNEPTHEGLLTMRNDDIDKHRAKFAVCRYDSVLYHPTIKEIIDGLDSGKWTYEDVVFDFKHEVMGIRDGFNPDWNSLEEYTEGKTKLLHYTEMYNQPWLKNPNHPLGHLWFSELKEAVVDGSIPYSLVQDHVYQKLILPKCLEVLHALV